MTVTNSAIEYGKRGWNCIPVAGKNPSINGVGWEKLRYTEEATIRKRFKPQHNVGVILGQPSHWLVDVDLDHDLAIKFAGNCLPSTQSIFGRKGKPRSHWLYIAEGAELYQRKHREAGGMIVELRSTGGQTVFPGSTHPSGELVEWVVNGEPAIVDASELKARVDELADKVLNELGINQNEFAALIGSPANATTDAAGGVEIVSRARAYIGKMDVSVSGCSGHNAAFEVANVLVRGFTLKDEDAAMLMREWNVACKPPWSERELQHKIEQARHKSPREWGYILDREKRHVSNRAAQPIDSDCQPWGRDVDAANKLVPTLHPQGRTDIANSDRLLYMHGHKIRYVGSWKKWIVFNGRYWQLDETERLQSLAKDVSRMLFDELDQNAKNIQFTFAKQSANISSIDAAIKLCRDAVAVHHEELNRDPWLLNVQNGTLDLRTGDLRAHDRNDLITKIAPVIFTNAECPHWISFLNRIFDQDQDLIDYVQQLVGYFLTGVVAEHILPVFYGTGANGKTTMINVLSALLGDYCGKASQELLIAGKQEHKTIYADLYQKRLMYSEETGASERLAESQVKDLTGGGAVVARRMREDLWQFQPTHKLLLATNHKPDIRGTDNGIWRRVKLVPFNVRIPQSEQDQHLTEKLKSELSGILNWAIEGCMSWQKDGLAEPDVVKEATASYRAESDELGQFIDEYCVLGQACFVQATRLHRAYQDSGGTATQTMFGRIMTERKFERCEPSTGPNRKKRCYRGIGLRAELDD